ncbi:HTH-like domain-containing protein [Paenibacillus durus]
MFGIKFADIILRNSYSVKEIVSLSGLNTSYAFEVSKGIKLSKYVIPK